MKICDFCKNEIDENAKFCPVCGAEQKSEPIAEQPQAAEAAETEPLGTSSFGNSQPEAMPFGAAPVNQNQPPVNSGTYFTPGANVNVNPNTEMFNGGAPVQNVAQRKKGKGGKIAVIILVIIIAVIGGILSFSIVSSILDDEKTTDPSAGTSQSQSAGEKTIVGQGVFDETGYTNSALGLRIDCPDGWVVLKNDEIAEYFQTDIDESGKVVDEYGWVYEFAALNTRSDSDIDVQSIKGNLSDKLISHDDWLEIYMENYEEDGDVMSEPYEMTIGSTTYKCFDCDSSYIQTPIKERVLTYKEGKEFVVISIWIYPEAEDEGVTLDSLVEEYFKNN